MKKDILKQLLLSLVMTALLASCSEENERQACVLQRVSVVDPDDYQLIEYNANGTIGSVIMVYSGVESERFDYSYTPDKLTIYRTNGAMSNELMVEIGLDTQGRPISRTENNIVYERYFYNGDRLDHIMWSDKDSISFSYTGANKNPDSSEFYGYNASDQTWTLGTTTTFTFDEHSNPLKGLILPHETNFNIGVTSFSENNVTSYSSGGFSWYHAYTYNAEGYPVSRKLTSSFQDLSETKDFTYDCH